MPTRLTKRLVESVRPAAADILLYDTEVMGFGVRVGRGGARAYFVEYRLRTGQRRRQTIGRHGAPWTVELARKEALRLLGQVVAGIDPRDQRLANRGGMTVAQLCDLYLREGCRWKKASTLATDRGRIDRHIKPLLGNKLVSAVSGDDVAKFLSDIAAGKTAADIKTKSRGRAIVRGGEGTASRTTGLLGGIFTFAVEAGIREDNPVQGVRRYADRKNERYLSQEELRRLGDALAAAEGQGVNPVGLNAIRLLLFTGARKSEILTLRWQHVDLQRGMVFLPDSKTGAKPLYLAKPAVDLLASLTRSTDIPWVFPSQAGDSVKSEEVSHFVGLPRIWERVRKAAKLEGVRLHDLRHTFASIAVSQGDSLPMIGKLLGHTDVATTQRYAHLADDPVRRAAEGVAIRITAALESQTDKRNENDPDVGKVAEGSVARLTRGHDMETADEQG